MEPGRRLYFRSGGLSGRFDSTGISYLDVPARPAAPTEVAVREATSTSITLAFQPDGQQLEYRLADGSSQHDGWQSSRLFRDLQPETDYPFQVRKAAVMPGGAGQGGLGSDGGDAKNARRGRTTEGSMPPRCRREPSHRRPWR
ncbi:MAG: fibronectin type III domain-containing protein [Gordonibacter pamelaeae]